MRIIEVTIGEAAFEVELDDGRVIEVPYRLYPRLSYGSRDELKDWRLIGHGEGIHWDALDEDISLENIVAGEGSHESRTSFRTWLGRRNQLTMDA